MKRVLILAAIAGLFLSLPVLTSAGSGRPGPRPGPSPRGSISRGWVDRGVPIYRYTYPGFSYYSPPIVVSPYGPSYYLPPIVEVTAPYFCLLHGAGYMTRAGLLDHLAGTHKFTLRGAADLCSDGVDSCVYPMP